MFVFVLFNSVFGVMEVKRRWHNKQVKFVFPPKDQLGSILLSCLGKGFQRYFLLDMCSIILAHHSQTFKQLLLTFLEIIYIWGWLLFRIISGQLTEKSQWTKNQKTKDVRPNVLKLPTKFNQIQNNEPSYRSINEKLQMLVFSLWRNWWRLTLCMWCPTVSLNYRKKIQLKQLIRNEATVKMKALNLEQLANEKSIWFQKSLKYTSEFFT